MAQMTVRQIDEGRYAASKTRARLRGVSVEALARDAIHGAGQLSTEEKLALFDEMQEWSRQAMVPGVRQTPGWVLIREDRDSDDRCR